MADIFVHKLDVEESNKYFFDDSEDFFSFDSDKDICFADKTFKVIKSEEDFDILIKLFEMMKEDWILKYKK